MREIGFFDGARKCQKLSCKVSKNFYFLYCKICNESVFITKKKNMSLIMYFFPFSSEVGFSLEKDHNQFEMDLLSCQDVAGKPVIVTPSVI